MRYFLAGLIILNLFLFRDAGPILDTLAPDSFISQLSLTFDVIDGDILYSDADMVILPSNQYGIGSGIDGVFYSKVKSVLAKEKSADNQLEYFLKNKKGALTKLEKPFEFVPYIIHTRGLTPSQDVFYVPTSARKEKIETIQLNELTQNLTAILLWAKANNKRTIDLTAINTGAYRFDMGKISDVLKMACENARYVGHIRIYVNKNPELLQQAQESLLGEDIVKNHLGEYDTIILPPQQIVNQKAIHARPSTALTMLAQELEKQNIHILQIAKLEELNQPPIAKVTVEDRVMGPMDFLSLALLYHSYVQFTFSVPKYMKTTALKIELQEKITSLFEGQFMEWEREDAEEYKKAAAEKRKEFIYSISNPIYNEYVNPRIASVFTALDGFPIVRHIPQNTNNEFKRLEFVASYLLHKEILATGTQVDSAVENVSYRILKELVLKTKEIMRDNPHFNAEFAVAVAAQNLYNKEDTQYRSLKSTSAAFEQHSRLIFQNAKKLIALTRSPFLYGFPDSAEEKEAESYVMLKQDVSQLSRYLKGLVHHVERSKEKQEKIMGIIDLIISDISEQTRQSKIHPWMQFSEALNEYIDDFIQRNLRDARELVHSGKLSKDAFKQIAKENLSFRYKCLLIDKINQLYCLGQSYFDDPFFDVKNLITHIEQNKEMIENKNIATIVEIIKKRPDYNNDKKWDAINLYEFILAIITPEIPAIKFLNVLLDSELGQAINALEKNRRTLLEIDLQKQSLESLSMLPASLNVGIVAIKSNTLTYSDPLIREIRKMFTSANVVIVPKETDLWTYGNKSICSFEGLNVRFIGHPTRRDYSIATEVERNFKEATAEGKITLSDGQSIPTIFGHNETVSRIGKLIHITTFVKNLSNRLLPTNTAALVAFLENKLKSIPDDQPFTVALFQNYHSENRITGKIFPELTGTKNFITVQIKALEEISKRHPTRKITLVPQSTKESRYYDTLLDTLLNSSLAKENSHRVTLLNLVSSPYERKLPPYCYIHLNHIIDSLANGELNEGNNFTYALAKYLERTILNSKTKELFFVGDYLSEPAIALYIAALNLIRIKRGLPSVTMAIRKENQLPLEQLYSSVSGKDLLKQIYPLMRGRILTAKQRKKIDDYVLWANTRMNAVSTKNITTPFPAIEQAA